MDVVTLSRLGVKHTKSAVAESLRINTGLDMTTPVTFYGIVNERCNVKCRQCEYWRLKEYKDEMTIEDWQNALLSVKEFVGEFSINFSGGEPYIKKGFLDLLTFANKNGIHAGVTTNGYCMTKENAAKTVAARPFNVNMSVDGPNAELHDYLRGQPGLFDRLSKGIVYLREEQEKQNVLFPINVKPTINRLNFRHLEEIVTWAKGIGATTVNFQPVNRWTPETYSELWIEEADREEFSQVIERLIEMKKNGAPIMNSDEVLRLMVPHFQEEKAPDSTRPCRVGLRNYWIDTRGDVKLCDEYPVIGNVKEANAREIWYGEKAQEVRRDTLNCGKLCLITCVSQKTILDKVKMGMKLLKN
ncbi:radical SAM protein [Microcoleus sp. A006_D1]|uniref:radical SAM protein n=1 Tax=Microcoleus sp. A006_D1 TaxID=3055267 RepID=UPI002FD389A6